MTMPPIDWQSVVLHLRRAGYSSRRLARELAVSESAVRKWASGNVTCPSRLETCLRLLDLHLDHCPDRHRMDVIGG